MKRNEQAKGLKSYFYGLSASGSQSMIFPVQSKACLLQRIFAGKKRREEKYILKGWHNFLLKTSCNAESPGKIFQFDFPGCESNQKLLSRFNLLMRSSDWKLVMPLSA